MTDPRCSIITYSHDPEYLTRLWKYLTQDEALNSWEWIVGFSTNAPGKSSWERIEQLCNDSPNISLLHIPTKKNATTATYLSACVEEAQGEYLLFLAHGTFPSQKLLYWLDQYSEKADFMYGDFAFHRHGVPCLTPTLSEPYWETYKYIDEKDGEYLAYKAPPIRARSLYEYNLAPHKALIWKRKLFNTMGGFNLQLNTGYEYEMVCRTYISNRTMHYISDFCVSFSEHQDLTEEEIQLQAGIGHQYFFALIGEEAIRNGLKIYSLSFHKKIPEGHEELIWTGGELVNSANNHVEDSSIGVINASDYLNFIPQHQVIQLVEEIWRVLAPNGWFISSTPSSRGAGAFADPRQASYWNNLTFAFFCLTKEIDLNFKGSFQHTRVWENFPTTWHKDKNVPYVHANLMKLEV